jgi:integrase
MVVTYASPFNQRAQAMSTFRRKLTDAYVAAIKPPKAGQDEHFDKLLPAFAVRVGKTGIKSFVVFYRHRFSDGLKVRRYTLGRYPVLKLAEAREMGRLALQDAAAGKDPAGERQEAKATVPDTVGSAVVAFLEKHAKARGNRSAPETERIFRVNVLPAVTGSDRRPWKTRELRGIGRRDVIELVESIAERAPYMANRTLAAVRKLFNWCAGRDMIEASPCANVSAPAAEASRDRALTEAEISAFWHATGSYPFGAAFRFLLVTGQRLREVTEMARPEIDPARKVWTIPATRAKNGVAHAVPLSPLALEILDGAPKLAGPFIFSTTGGERPIGGISRAKASLDRDMLAALGKNAKLPPWRLHDLRRTCGTGLQALRISSDVIGAVLNHKKPGVTARYLRHDYSEEKAAALAAWSNKLGSIIRPAPVNVVALHG